jgi:undecaprenyl pyrophosphate phosphatase UppP
MTAPQGLLRPGSPTRIALGVLTLVGAIFAVLVADTLAFVDCAAEASSECTDAGQQQQIAAYVGLVPAIATSVACLRSRGRPKLWLVATALIYGVWIVLAVRWSNASEPG